MQKKQDRDRLSIQENELNYPFFELDLPVSLYLAKKYSKEIKPNRCYDNLVQLVLNTDMTTRFPNLRIAYGCVELEEILIQHAFFYDSKSKTVIDPTLAKKFPEKHNCYLIAILLTYEDFSESIDKFKNPDPMKNHDIQREMKQLALWCHQHKLILIG